MAIVATLAFTASFLIARYASLPDLLPVHFKRNGFPNWQYKTLWRVLMPLFVQAALASTLGSIAMLLLSRSDLAGPDTSEPGTSASSTRIRTIPRCSCRPATARGGRSTSAVP